MITGFNTDIPHEGVTYHVQTEDKGLDTPLILSLVYVGGAIIASKRTTYEDLIAEGFDEKVLTERLQRQHKLICAAIRAGRVEDLKRMGEHEGPREAAGVAGAPEARKAAGGRASKSGTKSKSPAGEAPPPEVSPEQAETVVARQTPKAGTKASAAPPASESVAAAEPEPLEERAGKQAGEQAPAVVEELYLSLLDDEGDFRAGQLATVKIHVGRGAYGQQAVADAEVIVKVLGTSFRPIILNTNTDADGLAVIRALLPRFTSGRAAIIIRASDGGEMAELRRIIHQS
ncbi:MAG TPA: hypothetical protein VFS10_14500 [Pyrinomonadaceae bacterium]|nr:hypothetical protein [Pyrinomonadaceae bacterium]